MKTSTLFAALSAAAMTLCTAAAAAQSVQSAPQAEAPAPGTSWSLDDCIGYALHNNVGVQQQALQVEQTDVKLSTSKYSRLPDLSASVGYNATFGRGTSDDNIRKTGTIQSGSFDVGASMPLFDGFRINREIKGGKARPRRRHAGFGTRTRRPVNQRHDAVPAGSLQQGA